MYFSRIVIFCLLALIVSPQPDNLDSYLATYSAEDNARDLALHKDAPSIAYDATELSYIAAANSNLLPTQEERTAYLAAHNRARKQLRLGYMKRTDGTYWPQASTNLPNLVYSQVAEVLATNWAQTLSTTTFNHNPSRQVSTKRYGENIAYSGSTNPGATPADAMVSHIKMYYDEGRCASSVAVSTKSSYDSKSYDTNCVHSVGHFTQVVWAKTLYVGCGYKKQYIAPFHYIFSVCNYNPGGNMSMNSVKQPIYV